VRFKSVAKCSTSRLSDLLRHGKRIRVRRRRPTRVSMKPGARIFPDESARHISDAFSSSLRRRSASAPVLTIGFQAFSKRTLQVIMASVRASCPSRFVAPQPRPTTFLHIELFARTRKPRGKNIRPVPHHCRWATGCSRIGSRRASAEGDNAIDNSPYLPLTHWWQNLSSRP